MKRNNLTNQSPSPSSLSPPAPVFLNINQTSELLNISKSKIYSLTSAKIIPHYKLAGLRFRQDEILEWFEKFKVNQERNL
jgi:excisionase family DNA binding protein